MKLKLSRAETLIPEVQIGADDCQMPRAAHSYLRGILNYSLWSGAVLVEFYYVDFELCAPETLSFPAWEEPTPDDAEKIKALMTPFAVLIHFPSRPYEAIGLHLPPSFIKWIRLHIIQYLGLNPQTRPRNFTHLACEVDGNPQLFAVRIQEITEIFPFSVPELAVALYDDQRRFINEKWWHRIHTQPEMQRSESQLLHGITTLAAPTVRQR